MHDRPFMHGNTRPYASCEYYDLVSEEIRCSLAVQRMFGRLMAHRRNTLRRPDSRIRRRPLRITDKDEAQDLSLGMLMLAYTPDPSAASPLH